MFRLSRISDEPKIKCLIADCFGMYAVNDAIKDLNGRYLIYERGLNILGMSGLLWSSSLNAYEIDWSCVVKSARRQGIMHDLFKRLCGLTDEKIYCSCWRLTETGPIELKSLMRDFGFHEVIHSSKIWKTPYNCRASLDNYNYCSNYKSNCMCWEDLYVRDIQ